MSFMSAFLMTVVFNDRSYMTSWESANRQHIQGRNPLLGWGPVVYIIDHQMGVVWMATSPWLAGLLVILSYLLLVSLVGLVGLVGYQLLFWGACGFKPRLMTQAITTSSSHCEQTISNQVGQSDHHESRNFHH